MASPRTLLVVNPRSQNGTLGKRWPQLSQRVRRHLGSFEEAFTEGPEDATRIATEALKDGVDVVVAIGGDGTINEVANGFFENGEPVAPNASMGILPIGTGGDFRKTIGLPKDLDKAAEILSRFQSKRIDLGKLAYTTRDGAKEQRIFVNIASFGMSGKIDEEVNSSSKRLGGKLTFMLATAKVGMRFKGKRVRIVFDGDEDTSLDTTISTIAVANGQFFGGGMQVAPNAAIDDGRFDVVSIGNMGTFESIWKGRHLYSGTHLNLDNVSERRATSVYAESADGQEVVLDVDGETPGVLPATFTVMPEALSLIAP
ncbi:MAG: diacylglycerol kinase family lipid kinase [Myxococcales bacterium]|nr:diacylglycerol kinase family lipid kinase [Myxococcales bacterium]